jgi:hypothetical protein
VHDAPCSFCRFIQAAWEPAGREKWHGIRRLRARMLQGLILIDALSSACWERKKKKEKKK